MGMFNYVKVQQELPLDATLNTLNHNWRDEEFQTKELEDSVMATYILKDNKLYEVKEEGHFEDIPKEEREISPENKRWGNLFKQRWVITKTYENFRSDYTGTFIFGCMINGNTIDSLDFFPDWKAVVVQGEVKELTLIPAYSKYSSRERIENNLAWEKQIETHNNKMKCPVYKFYFNYYVRSVERLGRSLQRVCSKISESINWFSWRGIGFVVKVLTPK